MHQWNTAKRAIRNLGITSFAGLETTDTDLTVSKTDLLINQAAIKFNLLRNYQLKPNLSSYTYTLGKYNLNQ